MTDSTALNLLCAAIAGIPMFFVAWKISRISDDVDKSIHAHVQIVTHKRKDYNDA